MKELIDKPIFFRKNRVWRVYTGGLLLGELMGDEEKTDSNYPEEWIASTVKAENQQSNIENEGLSVIEGTETTLKELVEAYREEVLGSREDLGVLVKYLDSAVRLPLQAHPDKAFSRRYFNSEYGKTEMWLILKTRENANICFGFKNSLTKEQFSELIEKSETDKSVMDQYLNKIPVQEGDVFLIPAKAVHAIGEGCCILEVQEPTDFTIQPEYWCAGHRLSDSEMYMNLKKEDAINCFDFSVAGDACIGRAKKIPSIEYENEDFRKEVLIGEKDTECFGVNRYTVYKSMELSAGPAVYIALGDGKICGDGYERTIKEGDYFMMPYCAAGKYTVETGQGCGMEVIECLPPKK